MTFVFDFHWLVLCLEVGVESGGGQKFKELAVTEQILTGAPVTEVVLWLPQLLAVEIVETFFYIWTGHCPLCIFSLSKVLGF